jgi:hypothetical protein
VGPAVGARQPGPSKSVRPLLCRLRPDSCVHLSRLAGAPGRTRSAPVQSPTVRATLGEGWDVPIGVVGSMSRASGRTGFVRQDAHASGSGRIHQAGGHYIHLDVGRDALLAIMMAAIAIVLVRSDTPVADAAPVFRTGTFESKAEEDARCVFRTPDPELSRAFLTGCRNRQTWEMAEFANGYVRFHPAGRRDVCLGTRGESRNGSVVGTWRCDDWGGAWKRDERSGGQYVLENQLAEENGWTDRCLTHRGEVLRLGRCTRDDARHWVIPG